MELKAQVAEARSFVFLLFTLSLKSLRSSCSLELWTQLQALAVTASCPLVVGAVFKNARFTCTEWHVHAYAPSHRQPQLVLVPDDWACGGSLAFSTDQGSW